MYGNVFSQKRGSIYVDNVLFLSQEDVGMVWIYSIIS